LVTNRGGIYGTGHHNRMCLLKERLQETGITAEVVFSRDLAGIADLPPVVLLDSRDDEFPAAALQRKTAGHYFIAVDNRGRGRGQGDITWDTLPHMQMNEAELQISLKNCILDPVIVNAGALPETSAKTSKIWQMSLKEIEALTEPVDLIQYASNLRASLDKAEFHRRLVHSKRIATYYGQTFFEALFLGREIYLYDISDYHKELADWFTKRWNDKPELARVLDGGGLNRLAAFIASRI